MRLTDEEKAIAGRVAEVLVEAWQAFQAWLDGQEFRKGWAEAVSQAMYSPESRVSLQGETPGTATAAVVGGDASGSQLPTTPPEVSRTYHYADGTRFTIREVTHLLVRPSGTHRLQTKGGRKWIIPPGWIAIEGDWAEWEQLNPADTAIGSGTGGTVPGIATAAGVGACEVEVRVGQGDDGTGVPLTARVVRPATAAGVGAPPAEAVSEEVVGYAVIRPPLGVTCLCGDRRNADEFAKTVGGTVVPLVRQGSPRGVVVTEAQRWAIKRAASFLRRLGYHEFDPWPGVEARSLDDLLAAIDAAKGGG